MYDYFSDYVTISTLRAFNAKYNFKGEISSDVYQLGCGLVAVNVFDKDGNVLHIRNIEPSINIRFECMVCKKKKKKKKKKLYFFSVNDYLCNKQFLTPGLRKSKKIPK